MWLLYTGNSVVRGCVLAPRLCSRPGEEGILQDLGPGKNPFDLLEFVQRQALSRHGQTLCEGHRHMPDARTWRWSGTLAIPTVYQRASRRKAQVICGVSPYGRIA